MNIELNDEEKRILEEEIYDIKYKIGMEGYTQEDDDARYSLVKKLSSLIGLNNLI